MYGEWFLWWFVAGGISVSLGGEGGLLLQIEKLMFRNNLMGILSREKVKQ